MFPAKDFSSQDFSIHMCITFLKNLALNVS